MKNYLITGGAGFIGSNFVRYMIDRYSNDDINIIVLDKLTYAGNLENLKDNMDKIKFIRGDICNQELLEYIFADYNIDYLINFAAESHVDRSIVKPEIFMKTNVLGTQNLLNKAKDFWKINQTEYKDRVKFLQVSTDEVYGSLGNEGYFNESSILAPNSPYSASKASADMMVRAYKNTYNLPVNITRCSNNYGPYQYPEKLIPMIISNSLADKEIPIYGDGKNIRDWIHVKDHCQAIDMVLHHGVSGEIYNVGDNNEISNVELSKMILQILGKPESLITFVSDRAGHDLRYALDASKIKNDIDWKAEYDFEEGLKETIEWYLNNKDWW
ncbi:MAG: dTDP-glucose 4,6-dehydratase [bacterium]